MACTAVIFISLDIPMEHLLTFDRRCNWCEILIFSAMCDRPEIRLFSALVFRTRSERIQSRRYEKRKQLRHIIHGGYFDCNFDRWLLHISVMVQFD